ncbi:MAG: hypothetical protein QME71_11040 [Dehalococcoidia bacterium]|nr:hypothetical protein [Dehalococcoidia bacterium]
MRLVRNTTDTIDDYIEEMLHELEQPDDLPVAVKVKNSWKRRDFHGTFYPDASSRFLISPKGVKYVLGANDKGYEYRDLITLHVPPFPWPMLLDTNEKIILKRPMRESWGIGVPNRFIGLKLIAAHEVQHARLQEKLHRQSEIFCAFVMIELARKLNLRIAPWEEILREAEQLEEREWACICRDAPVPS